MIASQAFQTLPRIRALAPAPGLTHRAEFASALMPSMGALTLLRLQLFGRFSIADSKYYPCKTLEIDPNHIAISCQGGGNPGDRIDLDLDLLGVLHGAIETRMAAGLRINVGDGFQEQIAQKLAWFKACLGQGASDTDTVLFRERRAQRIVPIQTKCQFTDADDLVQDAEVLNISTSGAAIKSSYLPIVGAPIVLGTRRRRGLVVRRFDGGFAIAFLKPIFSHQFGPDMVI
jgi:hypothetical protein